MKNNIKKNSSETMSDNYVNDLDEMRQNKAKKKCRFFKSRSEKVKSTTSEKKKKLSKRKMLEEILNKIEEQENKLDNCIENFKKRYAELYSLVNEINKKIQPPEDPNGASKDVQASNTLTAIYSVYVEMEKCENFDQTKYQTYRLKTLLEEYENITGEKLAWRL